MGRSALKQGDFCRLKFLPKPEDIVGKSRHCDHPSSVITINVGTVYIIPFSYEIGMEMLSNENGIV